MLKAITRDLFSTG